MSLQVSHVSKAFGVVRALRDVSLDLRGGEVLALMGENGAGKSTLLKIMAGAYQPDAGGLALDRREVRWRSPLDARRAGLRVVQQEPDIVPGTSVAENLFVGELPRRGPRLVDWGRLNGDAARLLATFRAGSATDPAGPADALTPARRQMVEILRALRPGLKVLALDEPTSSLSEAEAEDLFALVRRLRSEGTAILYVSHRMHEVLRLADRVAVLRDGALVGVRPAAELDGDRLIAMMVGRALDGGMRKARHRAGAEVLRVESLRGPGVRGVSLCVRAGEVVSLAGLVGAGRTELARLIYGAAPREGGTVSLDGRPLRPRAPRDAVEAGLVYVPEERKADGLFPELSVLHNGSVAILRSLSPLRVVRRREERRVVGDLARRMRVKAPSLDQLVGKLSGGNQQKLVLARWLATKPRVLILDEPTRGIDVGAKQEIYALIDELAAGGTAILLISSEMPEVLGLSDRVLVLQGGRVAAEMDPATATEEAVLAAAMPRDATVRTA